MLLSPLTLHGKGKLDTMGKTWRFDKHAGTRRKDYNRRTSIVASQEGTVMTVSITIDNRPVQVCESCGMTIEKYEEVVQNSVTGNYVHKGVCSGLPLFTYRLSDQYVCYNCHDNGCFQCMSIDDIEALNA